MAPGMCPAAYSSRGRTSITVDLSSLGQSLQLLEGDGLTALVAEIGHPGGLHVGQVGLGDVAQPSVELGHVRPGQTGTAHGCPRGGW